MNESGEESERVRRRCRTWRCVLGGVLSCAMGCGAEESSRGGGILVPNDAGAALVTVRLDSDAYLLEQSVTAVALVTGTPSPVTWSLACDTGRASLVADGNSARISALDGGICFVTAAEDPFFATAIVRIPPLATGDSCTADSQCGEIAPRCGSSNELVCGPTCTIACKTDNDCPIADPFGRHVPCNNGLCVLVRDPDYSCP